MVWSARDISARYGDTIALRDVSLQIEPGRVHAVIGGDGAGKSTFLKVLARLDVGQTGSVDLPHADRIAFVPSTGGIFGDLTVNENLEFVAEAYRLSNWQPRASELLDRAAISEFGARLSGQMSGGQRRKLAGCMALLPSPDLLVLDEVTTGVDPVSRMELWRLMTGAAAAGAAVVVSTTYLDEAERMESVLLLHEGQVLGSGSPASIIDSIPGVVSDTDSPIDRSRAWRNGRRWRQWSPIGDRSHETTLEDAAIVLELLQSEANQ